MDLKQPDFGRFANGSDFSPRGRRRSAMFPTPTPAGSFAFNFLLFGGPITQRLRYTALRPTSVSEAFVIFADPFTFDFVIFSLFGNGSIVASNRRFSAEPIWARGLSFRAAARTGSYSDSLLGVPGCSQGGRIFCLYLPASSAHLDERRGFHDHDSLTEEGPRRF